MLPPPPRHPLQRPLNRIQLIHPFNPLPIILKLSYLLAPSHLRQQALPDSCPRPKRQVGVCAFAADEPASPVASEPEIEHADDADDFGDVACGCGGEGRGVEACEVGCLAEVGALACVLY